MRTKRCAPLAALLAFAAAASPAGAWPFRDASFVHLLRGSGYGMLQYEEAAWLVLGPDGTESLIHWPPPDRENGQRWRGPLPTGTVALLHTHPADRPPRPSVLDQDVASRLRLPVYTISRWAIYRADPDGTVALVRSRYWTPTIDWALADRENPSGRDASRSGEGSSSGTSPGMEASDR